VRAAIFRPLCATYLITYDAIAIQAANAASVWWGAGASADVSARLGQLDTAEYRERRHDRAQRQ
jgi:hypothetical protein